MLAVHYHLPCMDAQLFSVISSGSSVNTGGCVFQTYSKDTKGYSTLFPKVMLLLYPCLCRFEIVCSQSNRTEVFQDNKVQLADFYSPADLILNY